MQIFAPDRRRLRTIDSPNGAYGPEEVRLLSAEDGRYRLEVTAPSAKSGRYCPRLQDVRRPTRQDRDRTAADQELYDRAGDAEARYRKVIPRFAKLGDRWHEAVALLLLAHRVHRHAQSGEAMDLLDQAESLFQAAGDRRMMILTHMSKGIIFRDRFDFTQALKTYQSVVRLADQPELTAERATAFHNLGFLYQIEGESWQALGAFRQAIETWQRLPDSEDREYEANSRTGLGWVYASTGDWERASEAHQGALELRKRYSTPAQRAVSDIQIGAVLLHDSPRLALIYMEKAQRLQAEAGSDAHDQAATLNGLGRIHAELGHLPDAPDRNESYRRAEDLFQRALALYADDPSDQASTLINLGWIDLDLGKPGAARQSFDRALGLARQAKDLLVEARALYGQAEAAFRAGDLPAAQSQAQAALDLCERLRAAAVRTDLQTSYLAANVNVYNLLVRIFMELDRRQPGQGHYLQAFEYSEQSRARALLDALRESGGRQAGIPGDLLVRREQLRAAIAALDRQRGRPDTRPGDAAVIERRLSEELGHLYELNADVGPQRGAVSPASLDFTAQRARQLLGPDTLLLEYSMGRPSYLWAVSAAGVQSFRLPESDELEPLLRSAAERLGSRQGPDEGTLRRLSGLLLGPVAGLLRGKRLLIAADGGAQYVPFGALPEPGGPPGPLRPLLADHEIDYVPSLAALAELRSRRLARAPAPLPLAILADPVFDWKDPRLKGRGIDNGEPFYAPLHETRMEAQKIAQLLPTDQAFEALGFDASRELVISGRLKSYQILHFAAHGEFKTDHPELSALVLSRLTRQGKPRDGSLRVSDLQGVKLPADLVVLSACETALGRETPGEGLVGLPQAFLTAGASRVVVSLWRVDKDSTATLMVGFYRRLLAGHQPPGEALREAQLEVRADPRWRAPRYWAGFVLQGEWQ